MTEGLLAEVFAKAERFGADDPSVLTADKVCKIWALRVSRIIVVFETSEPCRKPAPFGKGAVTVRYNILGIAVSIRLKMY